MGKTSQSPVLLRVYGKERGNGIGAAVEAWRSDFFEIHGGGPKADDAKDDF